MIIEQYGIRLKRLTHGDIELVRQWRNHPDIRKTMAYRKYITRDMQEKWFASIDNALNYYFLIEYKGRDIGVINTKNINLDEMYGEGGIFIWEKASENEFAGVLASLCFLNAVFFILKIFNKSFIQVLRTNGKATAFNRSLGYVLVPGQPKNKNPYYILTREDYESKTRLLRKTAAKMTNDQELPRVEGRISDKNLPEINRILEELMSSK